MDQKLQEMLERFKITAATAAEAAGKAADSASKKAGNFVELTKLNLTVFDLNTDIEILMREIGQEVYRTHKGEEVEATSIEAKLLEIDAKYEKIKEIKGDIQEKKRSVRCPNCGKDCDKANAFCSACGAAL